MNDEDALLASLGTSRESTANYESDVLRQATLQLAPTLELRAASSDYSSLDNNRGGDHNNNSNQAVVAGFSNFWETASWLPFSVQNQAKANTQVILKVLAKVQSQLEEALQESNNNTGGTDIEEIRLLATKQHMLLSALGDKKKFPDVWQKQTRLEAQYQQREREHTANNTHTNGATTRRARTSMMQHKHIPGAEALAKATKTAQERSNKSKTWNDWSSSDDDDEGSDNGEDAIHNYNPMLTSRRTRMTSMNQYKRRAASTNPSKIRGRPASMNRRRTTDRRPSKAITRVGKSTLDKLGTPSESFMEEDIPKKKRASRAVVASYREESDDEEEHEFSEGLNGPNQTQSTPSTVHQLSNSGNDDQEGTEETEQHAVVKQEMLESIENGMADCHTDVSATSKIQFKREEQGNPVGNSAEAMDDTSDEHDVPKMPRVKIEERGAATADNKDPTIIQMSNNDKDSTSQPRATTEDSSTTQETEENDGLTSATCPLCQAIVAVEDAAELDSTLSQHMAECQTGGLRRSSRASARTSTRARTVPNYNEELGDASEEEDVDDGSPSRSPAKRKRLQERVAAGRKRRQIVVKDEEDFIANDDNIDVSEPDGQEGDDSAFQFDDEVEDTDDEEENDAIDIPDAPSNAIDDYALDDYEDRVDYWAHYGIAQMKDMGALRDEDDEVPGSVVLPGQGHRDGLSVPAWVNDRLFPYQRTGLEWMWQLHQQEAGGVLGDDMGLGKTCQTAAFLGSMAISRQLKGVLIISPATMLQHWLKELATWAPGLRRVLIHASGDATGKSHDRSSRNVVDSASYILRNLRIWLKAARRDRVNERIDHTDEQLGEETEHTFCGTGYVVVTTYEHVRRNQDTYVNHSWSYVVLDEAQKIRNPNADITLACKRLRTPHRIAITGTPIQNDLRELWSLFDFVFPSRLGTLPAFEQEFAEPIKRGGYSNASPVQVQLAYRCSLVLRDLIDPFLLRRQKHEIKEVSRMPGKVEQVLFCRLSQRQRSLYEAYLRSDVVKNIFKGSTMLFAAVTMLRKICNHPDLIVSDPSDAALDAFIRNGCVPDNPQIDDEDYDDDFEIPLDDPEEESLVKRSGKLEVLSKILPLWHKQGHRVLIFCQWRKMLNIIQQFITLKGWKFARLDGNTNVASRQRLVDTFNADPSYFVMLCTSRTGGVGLNLQGANRVILYDPDWNPQTDAQARERAWRFGQQKQVTIYRLITAGTIEEKMYQRQIFKTALTNKVLHDPRQRRLFSQKDLRDLLTLQEDSGSARSGGDLDIETAGKVASATKSQLMDTRPDTESSLADDGETLKKIFKSKGLAGVFDHDFVDPAGKSASKSISAREMEEQAERIAKEAAKALKLSVSDEPVDQFEPTWTGSSESRFGGGVARLDRGMATASSRFGGTSTVGVLQSNAGSSGSLLASLREKNAEIQSGGGSRRPSGSSAASSTTSSGSKYTKLMTRIRDYIKDQSPTTDDLLAAFSNVKEEDAAIFRKLLNKVAKSDRGKWRLRKTYA